MKFGKRLQLGIYEPWKDYYIPYSRLKRLLARKQFIKEKNDAKKPKQTTPINLPSNIEFGTVNENLITEISPLTYGGVQSYRGKKYKKNIDESNIDDFFPIIYEEVEKINVFYEGKIAEIRLSLEDIIHKRDNSYRSHHTGDNTSDLSILRDAFINLEHLKRFCGLNQTGFYKIVKKYDKMLGEATLEQFMGTVLNKQPFVTFTELDRLLDIVTSFVSRDKLIEWQRFATEKAEEYQDVLCPAVGFTGLTISIIIFIITLNIPWMPNADPAARKCFALLVFAITMWVTEALPYFATAMMIPALVVFLGILKDSPTGHYLNADQAAQFVMGHMFNHTTMLLLGGYTISSAFSTCQLELRVSAWLQKKFGHQPKVFILAVMFLGLFLSMWINNHTAPILLSTILSPIVRDLKSDSRFTKALLMGLAVSCNFGGMMTPISSLQNVLAVQYLEQMDVDISFGRWICVALPFCVLGILISWVAILFIIGPNDIQSIPIVVYERRSIMGKRNIAVLSLSVVTMLLFATSSFTKDFFGDIGIISLCYVIIMFGSGLLTEVDFNSLSWHTLFLIGGGNVLGKAVASSGLLDHIASDITKSLPLSQPWYALLLILGFTMAVATFVSHTVASIILMPVVAHIGASMGMPEVVTIGAAFSVSAAMALPFSSFPNVNSLLMVDDFQRQYLTVQDFIKIGLPLSVAAIFLIGTVGYGLIWLIC